MNDGMSMTTICAGDGCTNELPPNKAPGRKRKWCSDKCRRTTTYVRFCVDCGTRLNSSDGNGPHASMRCVKCSNVHNGAEQRIWTREALLLAIEEWVAEHGEPPAASDWNGYRAREVLGDTDRAMRYEWDRAAGKIPCFMSVVRAFGSWNAAIEAAGYEPRARGGSVENRQRQRNVRAKTTA